MTRICLIFFSGLILFSCENRNKLPEGILKPDKMQAVLWDVIRADAFTTEFLKKDSAKNTVEENLKLQQQIFAIHHVSKVDFYRSYDYYKSNSSVLKELIDSMIRKSERQKDFKIRPSQAE